MFKFLLTIAISLWSLQVFAEDWQLIDTTKLGVLRLDRESVTRVEKYTKAVINYEFADLQKVAKPPYDLFNRRQDDVLVDCTRLELGVIARRFYEDGKLVSSHELAMTDVKFNASAPDTMAEKVIKVVCADAPAAKP
ncbi:MAG: surface-adhesin E family protein [Gallionella sp.]